MESNLNNFKKITLGILALWLVCYTGLVYGEQIISSDIPQVVTPHKSITAKGKPVFIFEPRKRKWTVYDANGKVLKTGRASGGKNYCPDVHRRCRTPVGTFHVYAKKGVTCKSSRFPRGHGGAPMPYCSYFHHNFAIHGSHDVPSHNASHGCIRVHPSAAKWLQAAMPIGSKVIVKPY